MCFYDGSEFDDEKCWSKSGELEAMKWVNGKGEKTGGGPHPAFVVFCKWLEASKEKFINWVCYYDMLLPEVLSLIFDVGGSSLSFHQILVPS